jgi:glycosyltransferase involved in cell wall biosynthesis
MPKISVVIPCYNGEQYIAAALESVYAQSFGDYEVIVVDDGSTDGTQDVLTPYRDRLRYHHQDNQGLAVARNVGLSLAAGDYVTYLDADDIWEPDNLRVKHEVLMRFPDLGGVFSEFSIFDAMGERHSHGTKHLFPFFARTGRDYADIFEEHHMLPLGPHSVPVHVGNIFDSLFWGNFILPTSMVFSRARAKQVGEFRPHMRTQQDYEYWLRFSRLFRFAFVDHVLVRYRRHPEQLTHHSNIERILHAVDEIIDCYEQDFLKQGRARNFGRRKAELLANLAKVRHRQARVREARAFIVQSMSWDYSYLPAYGLYFLSFIPYHWLARMRLLLGSVAN